MRVRFNLATAPMENRRRFIAGASAAGAIAVIALCALSINVFRTWHAARTERQEIAQLESQMSALQGQRRDLENFFNAPQTRKTTDRAAFINTLIDQRSFPWTKIFTELEQTLPEGVRVISISQRMDKGRVEVTLTVGAATDEGKLKFLTALGESPSFSGVQVKSESRPNHQGQAPGDTDRVQLELVAWYSTT
jgi:Tfp pilus assembly protein PilN